MRRQVRVKMVRRLFGTTVFIVGLKKSDNGRSCVLYFYFLCKWFAEPMRKLFLVVHTKFFVVVHTGNIFLPKTKKRMMADDNI